MIIIQTKFSVLNKHMMSAWRLSEGASNLEQYKSKLFNKERLEIRLDIFVNYSLPNIDLASVNHKIVHHVIISNLLPQWSKDILYSAQYKYKWLHICEIAFEDIHPALIQNTIHAYAQNFGLASDSDDEKLLAVCRLDDDDILSPVFFDKLAQHIVPQFKGYVVTMPCGYMGIYELNRYLYFSKIQDAFHSIGMAYIVSYSESRKCITTKYCYPAGNHRQIYKDIPSTVCSDGFYFIRTVSNSNDSIHNYFDYLINDPDWYQSVSYAELSANFSCLPDFSNEVVNKLLKKVSELRAKLLYKAILDQDKEENSYVTLSNSPRVLCFDILPDAKLFEFEFLIHYHMFSSIENLMKGKALVLVEFFDNNKIISGANLAYSENLKSYYIYLPHCFNSLPKIRQFSIPIGTTKIKLRFRSFLTNGDETVKLVNYISTSQS